MLFLLHATLALGAAVSIAPTAAPTPWEYAERARIERWLDGALQVVEGADASHLGEAQREQRARMVDALRAYRTRAVFPHNHEHPGDTVPSFRDAHGTLCAMAVLVDASGRADLVEKIAQQRNHATILELADDTELVAWLLEHGLSLEEAARIQPGYTEPGCLANQVCDASTAAVLVLQTTDPRKGAMGLRDDGPELLITAKYGACHVGPSAGDKIANPRDEVHAVALLDERGEVQRWLSRNGDYVQSPGCGNFGISYCLTQDSTPTVDALIASVLHADCRAALAAGPWGRHCTGARASATPPLPPMCPPAVSRGPAGIPREVVAVAAAVGALGAVLLVVRAWRRRRSRALDGRPRPS